jgi:hypothetical protein
MLIEMAEDMIMRLCDGFGYYFQLLANIRSNALGGNNADPFKKLLYQDKIIPEAESIYEQWASFFDLEQYGLVIQKDYRHVPAMQEDQINEATASWRRNQGAVVEFQMNLITLNEWRFLNGDDPLSNGLGELYYYQMIAQRNCIWSRRIRCLTFLIMQPVAITLQNNNDGINNYTQARSINR